MKETCNICFDDIKDKMMCVFECQHSMCLDCFDKYSESNCHICRNYIDWKKLNFTGNNAMLFFKEITGNTITISGIDLNKMTTSQLHKLVEIKVYGGYIKAMKLIFCGKIIPSDDTVLNNVYPCIQTCSTLHIISTLRGD